MLQTILLRSISTHTYFDTSLCNAYEIAYKQNLTHIQETILGHCRNVLKSRIHEKWDIESVMCVLPPIVCNQPELLDSVLQNLFGHRLRDHLICLIHLVCHELKRHDCQIFFLKHGYADPSLSMTVKEKMEYLSETFYQCKMFRDKIVVSKCLDVNATKSRLSNILRSLTNCTCT